MKLKPKHLSRNGILAIWKSWAGIHRSLQLLSGLVPMVGILTWGRMLAFRSVLAMTTLACLLVSPTIIKAQTSVAVEGGVDGAATVTRVVPLPDIAVRDYPSTTEWLPIRVELPICVSWSEDSPTETCVLILPDAPHPHPPPPQKKGFWRANWIEIVSDGALLGADAFDIHASHSAFQRGAIEGGVIFNGRRPSQGQMWSVFGPIDIGLMVGEHYLARWAKKGTKVWPLAFGIGWAWSMEHIVYGIHSNGVCQPRCR